MRMIQLTGLSGAGKSTLATLAATWLNEAGMETLVIDGDVFRKTICKDLGFSKADRQENIRRLAAYAATEMEKGKCVIIAAINPFHAIRKELQNVYGALTVYIKCSLPVLVDRDTKGLYRRAMLPDGHPDKLSNLTGVNDPYEAPEDAELIISTDESDIESAAEQLQQFILKHCFDGRS